MTEGAPLPPWCCKQGAAQVLLCCLRRGLGWSEGEEMVCEDRAYCQQGWAFQDDGQFPMTPLTSRVQNLNGKEAAF